MDEIRAMRQATDQQLGVADCREALLATGGDIEKALEFARWERYRQARKHLPHGASTQLNW
jgi:translation elongation factor EF-Ts